MREQPEAVKRITGIFFEEVTIDDRVEENILRLPKDFLLRNWNIPTQPFFPNAAKDLFAKH